VHFGRNLWLISSCPVIVVTMRNTCLDSWGGICRNVFVFGLFYLINKKSPNSLRLPKWIFGFLNSGSFKLCLQGNMG